MRTVGSFAISEGCGGWRLLFSELPDFVGDLDAGRLVLPGLGVLLYPLWISRGSTFRSQGPDHRRSD